MISVELGSGQIQRSNEFPDYCDYCKICPAGKSFIPAVKKACLEPRPALRKIRVSPGFATFCDINTYIIIGPPVLSVEFMEQKNLHEKQE